MKKVTLLVVANSPELARRIGSLTEQDGVEVRELCPPSIEGLLKALTTSFLFANCMLITANAFAGMTVFDAIRRIKNANPNIRVYVLRTGGMEAVKESQLASAGCSGAYSTSVLSDREFRGWITRALKKEAPSFFLERARRKAMEEQEPRTPDDEPGDELTDDDSSPSGPVPPRRTASLVSRTAARAASPAKEEKQAAKPKAISAPVKPPIVIPEPAAPNSLTALWPAVVRIAPATPAPTSPPAEPEADTSQTVAAPDGKDVLKGLERLCNGVSNEVVLRALFAAAAAFVASLHDQAHGVPVAGPVLLDDVKSRITVKRISGKHSLVKLGYHEFHMFPSHAEIFRMIVLAAGETVQLSTIQKMFKMEHVHSARNIMAKVMRSLEVSVPELNGCIRNKRGEGYYFVPPVQ